MAMFSDAYLDPEIAGAIPSFLQRAHDAADGRWWKSAETLLEGRDILQKIVDVPSGAGSVRMTVFQPIAQSAAAPLIVNIHGGGMVSGDSDLGLEMPLQWLDEFGAVCVSVNYRLAPEHSYPAQIDDCLRALGWCVDNSKKLDIDPKRVVLYGVSAGGGLSASMALRLRDEGHSPLIGQMLVCPMLDDRNNSASMLQLEHGIVDQAMNAANWSALLGDLSGGPDVSEYAVPARATNLADLPPTFIDVGSADGFRDEDIAYASHLMSWGVDVELHVWSGGCHDFEIVAPDAEISHRARLARTDWIGRLLST